MTVTCDAPSKTPHDRLVLEAEGARVLGPTEAAALIREGLALACKRFDAAIGRLLGELFDGAGNEPVVTPKHAPKAVARARIRHVVGRDKGKFFPVFRTEFDRLFQARCQGHARVRGRPGDRTGPDALALVEEVDLSGQVALKNAVQAMRVATRQEGFGFDVRTRLVLREEPGDAEYQNPWGADLVCDALGNACRALWANDGVWQSIMEHLVRALTPELVLLHREIDALFRERDILPVLQVRARKRRDGDVARHRDAESLYDRLAAMIGRDVRQSAGRSPRPPPSTVRAVQATANPLDFGNPGVWRLPPDAALRGTAAAGAALATGPPTSHLLECARAAESELAAMTGLDLVRLQDGSANQLGVIARAVATGHGSALDRVTIEILAAVLDQVFDNAYLPVEIKTVFGRLQIPILKAALLDPLILSQPRHVVRRFFEALASASVGVRPGAAHDDEFVQLANRLVVTVRDEFTDDLVVFARVLAELDAFSRAETEVFDRNVAQALPALIADDERAAARASVRTRLAIHLIGKDIPAEVRAYLEHESVTRLTAADEGRAPTGATWDAEMQLVDDLVWSIAPEPGPEARRRLVRLVPQLVRYVLEGPQEDERARGRRAALMSKLYELHIESMQNPRHVSLADPERSPAAATRSMSLAASEDVDESGMPVYGDWWAFRDEGTAASLLAKFVRGAPHGSRLLFTHRDGTTAVIHTPGSLAREAAAGRAKVAVEAMPLFECAMEGLVERRSAGLEVAARGMR